MSGKEQVQAFSDDLERLVERYRDEFDLTYAQVVGVLEIQKHVIIQEALEDE